MLKTTKHDNHMMELVQRVSDNYEVVYTNYELFSAKRRKVAEIDIMGIAGNRVDIIEVKCSHRITKARHQLRKIRKHLKARLREKTINTFFYCGATGILHLMS